MRKLKWEYATIFFFKWTPNKIWIIHIFLSIRRPFSPRGSIVLTSNLHLSFFVGFCCFRAPVVGFMVFNISPASFYLTRCVWVCTFVCVFCIRNHFLWFLDENFSSSFFFYPGRSTPFVIAFLWISFLVARFEFWFSFFLCLACVITMVASILYKRSVEI